MDLNKIVAEARRYLEHQWDHKAWINEEGMLALIAAGAIIIQDHKQCDGTHVTEAIYEGIHFTHTGRHSLIPTNPILH